MTTWIEALRWNEHPFDELPFVERWITVWRGLGQPADTGEHKFARLQLLRLSAVGAAVLVPCLALLLLFLLTLNGLRDGPPPDSAVLVQQSDAPPIKPLDPIQPLPKSTLPEASLMTEERPQAPDLPDIADSLPTPSIPVVQTTSPKRMTEVAASLIDKISDGTPNEVKRRPGLEGPEKDGPGDPRFVHGDPHPPGTPGGAGEDAVFRGLRWLKKQQQSDGSWLTVRPAMTAFALLALLGHGELPGRSAEFGDCVQRGLEWMLANQEADGRFKGRDSHDYSQPIAAYALGEAAMLVRRPDIRYAAERAVAVVLAGQHPDGAWDYNCKQTDRRDTSYMGWCIQALKSAKLAKLGDASRLDAALKSSATAMRRQFGGSSDSGGLGGFGYNGPGSGARDGLTGVGVLSLQLAGAGGEREALAGLRSINTWTVRWHKPEGASPLYYWYYSTQAAFQDGGAVWARWNPMFAGELVRNQTPDPEGALDAKGSKQPAGYWDSPAQSEHHDGRVMDTCLCILMLEVYYRYLPSYSQPGTEAVVASAPRQGASVLVDGL